MMIIISKLIINYLNQYTLKRDLTKNSFTGPIPTEFGYLSKLEILYN